MTEIIIYKIIIVMLSGLMLFWTGDELFQHVKYRDKVIRWQWITSHVENRTADIIWIRSFYWLTFQVAAATAMAVILCWFVVTQ